MSRWPDPELTVSDRVGIGTDTPSQELDVIGDISATNLNLNGSLTIEQNLAVNSNFQLGTLSINEFSSDGNLADNSNLAIPTEQAVKTYVDNQINTRAPLNGAANQDFTAQNLTVGGNLQVSGDLEVQGNVIARDTEHIEGNVSLGDEDSDVITITGVVSSAHSSGALQVNSGLHTTGSVSVDGSLSVSNAIATAQLSVTEQVTGSLTVENNLIVGGLLSTSEVNATGTIQANKFEGDGSALTGISTGKWSDGSSGSIYYNSGNVGIGTPNPQAKLEVAGALKLSTAGTLLFHNTNESGNPNGDGFRLRYDNNFFGTNADALVVEKTDGNSANPDGGIAFVNTGNDGGVDTALVIRGNGSVGIGTTSPVAKLNIVHQPQNPNGNTLILGATNASNLRLGYHTEYSWIQSHGSKPLAINPIGNNVGIGTINPTQKLEVNGTVKAKYYEGNGAKLTGIFKPLAYACVLSNSTIKAKTPNVTQVTWNAGAKHYEITISGENYYYLDYVTVATAIERGEIAITSSVGGKLVVQLFNTNGQAVTGGFYFVTFKP